MGLNGNPESEKFVRTKEFNVPPKKGLNHRKDHGENNSNALISRITWKGIKFAEWTKLGK